MSQYPNLTDADSTIMEILWRDGECSSAAILQEIESKLNWSRQTVRTYLVRLMEKGLVGSKEINKRVYSYYPVISREEYAANKTGGLLSKYYGSLSHMVAGLIRNVNITDEDIDELDKLIRRLKKNGGESK
ncbi:MAG: BlaI/MecI/CopY family transcriptional regulator [Christensenellales bacterium]